MRAPWTILADLWEEFWLLRDPEFVESLRQADEDLRAGRTISLADLREELSE